jgi:hypothetical protein
LVNFRIDFVFSFSFVVHVLAPVVVAWNLRLVFLV